MSDQTKSEKIPKYERPNNGRGRILGALFAAALAATSISPFVRSPASAQQDAAKPNILVIFGDDVGQSNLSAYTRGLVGYKTPNIDRIANEGMIFTDYYAENSCTATPRVSSARTISAIGTNTCRRTTASTSSSAISII